MNFATFLCRFLGTLVSHTPQIWGVKISPPEFTAESSKNTSKQAIFEDSPPKFGGRIVTPQIWGVWVFREGDATKHLSVKKRALHKFTVKRGEAIQ